MGFKVIRYDDDVIAEYGGNKTEYVTVKSYHSSFPFKLKLDPSNGWAVPFVTGHKYKFHFGMTGLDYERLTISTSERWEATDKPIYLVHNWTDVRAAIDFTVDGKKRDNDTIDADSNNWVIGDHVVYNETAVRETHLIITGKN